MVPAIFLESYVPGQLETEIASFVTYYNHQRYHESLDNLTPAAGYFGRAKEVLTRRGQIKKQTMQQLLYNLHRLGNPTLANCPLCPKCSDDVQS
jgi:hypothetical protein